MFIAAGALVGIVVAYDDYSDHRKHSNHSNHSRYGDAEVVNRINDMQRRVNSQEAEVNRTRNWMQMNYREQIDQLKREKNYPALSGASMYNVVSSVKANMEQELENSIAQKRRELADIDRMIARINEIELQAKR